MTPRDSRGRFAKAPPSGAGAELGVTGLKQQAGIIREEWYPRLQGNKAARVYTEMVDNDQVISAILLSIEMRLRRVEWSVAPFSDDPEDVEKAEFLDGCRDDMSHTWDDFISEVLTMLPHGWAYMEQVYKQSLGPDPASPGSGSQHSDGLVRWRKMAGRAQDTLYRWDFDESGGIAAMVQQSGSSRVAIPIEKSLLFRTTTRRNNPEGRSVIRSAYRAYHFKRRIEEYEAVGIERDLAGIPAIGVPPALLDPQGSATDRAAAQEWANIGRNIRNDEQAFILYPLEYDADGNKRYDISLLASPGTKQFDVGAVVERWSRYEAMSVLADVILLGHEKVGSEALARTKAELLTLALDSWLGSVRDVLNRHAVPRLFALNGWRLDRLPTFEVAPVTEVDLAAIVEAISAISAAGAPLFPNDSLQEWLAGRLGAPPDAFAAEGEPGAAAPPRVAEPPEEEEGPEGDLDEQEEDSGLPVA